MTTSIVNTNVGFPLENRWEGAYDDTSGYQVVKVWTTVPAECSLMIYYSTTNNPVDDLDPEVYTVISNNAYAINSQVKLRYAKIAIVNNTNATLENVVVRTKFVTQVSHPFLTHITDNISSNISLDLENTVITQDIQHTNSNIQIYGTSTDANLTADHRAIRTDNSGCLQVTGSVANGVSRNVNPVIVGGRDENGVIRTLRTSATGVTQVVPTAKVGDFVEDNEPLFPIGGVDDGGAFTVLRTDAGGRPEVNICTIDGVVGNNTGFETVTLPVGISVGNNFDGTAKLAGEFDGVVNAIPVIPSADATFTLNDTDGLKVKPLNGQTVFNIAQNTGTTFKVNDAAGVKVKPLSAATKFTIKPDDTAKFVLNDGAGAGIKVQSVGAFNVAPATGATFPVDDTNGIQVRSFAGAQFSVKPVANSVFNVNDANGVKVQPLSDATVFKVTPDTTASFKLDDTGGIKIKPNDGAVLTVNPTDAAIFTLNDAAGISIKPFPTNTEFVVTPAANAKFPVKGSAGDDIKVTPLTAETQFPIKIATSSYFNSSKGYIVDDAGSYTQIGTGTVSTVYSLNICNTGGGVYYVKFYTGDTPTIATQIDNIPLMMHGIGANASRDIQFPRGISVNSNLYVLLSTRADREEQSGAIPNNVVYLTVTWD